MVAVLSDIDKPVIGRQYCVAQTAEYTLVQTARRCCTQNWSVIDAADQAVVFTLAKRNTNSSGWIPKFETQLMDAQGNIIARFKKKGCGRWKVFGGHYRDLLCRANACCCLFHGKTALKVFLAPNLSKKKPDYTIEFKKICRSKDHIIFHGTQSLAEVTVNKRSRCVRPTYTVTVNPCADCAFILLLVMIMEKRTKKHKNHHGEEGESEDSDDASCCCCCSKL